MSDDVERVRARLNIVDVVGRRIALKKAGKDFKGLCPFHDDRSPSLHVNPGLGIYKCFACGAGGDGFKFVQEFHKVDFREALGILAEELGIELTGKGKDSQGPSRRSSWLEAMKLAQEFFQEQLKVSDGARAYCDGRGISPDTIEEWGLGYGSDVDGALAAALKKAGFPLAECQELFLVTQDQAGGFYDRFRGRLTFPIFDEGKRIIAFGGRLIGVGAPGQPKYINSGDTPLYSKRRVLYGMHAAKDAFSKGSPAVLVEGYLDVIACHNAGVRGAVASLGTALSEDHAKMLSRWVQEVVVLYDADEAGEKAAERANELLSQQGVKTRVALMPKGEDPDTLLRTQGPSAIHRAVDGSLSPISYKLQRLRSKLAPTDVGFWEEAIEILSMAPRFTEVVGHIDELAAIHPHTRDRVAAQRALEQDVRRAMAQKHRNGPRAMQKGPSSISLGQKVHSCEATVLRALMSPEYFRSGWGALEEPGLMFTGAGVSAAEAILASNAEDKRKGPLALDSIQQTDAFSLLVELDAGSLLPISSDAIHDAVVELRRKREDRERQMLLERSSSEEDRRQELLERIKKKKFRVEKIEPPH